MKMNRATAVLSLDPELEAHWTNLDDDAHRDAQRKHLKLLIDYIRTAYASTTSRLASSLASVSMFSRNLKYYQGPIIRTTNRVKDYRRCGSEQDLSGIGITSPLILVRERSLWESFLKKAMRAKGSGQHLDLD